MTTRIIALTGTIGRPCALLLTTGNVADIRAAPTLISKAGRPRHIIADKGVTLTA